MKHILALLAFWLCIGTAMAFPARIQSWNLAKDINTINKLQISIDRVNHLDMSIVLYLRAEEEFQKLLTHGFDPVRMPDAAKDYYHALWESTRHTDNPLNQYYSIDEYHSFLQSMASQYPELCQVHQYGSSVQNRPLYVLKISDNVSQNEAEPEVKLIASIHGDEPIGYDMLIRTIQALLSGYGSDARFTNIVNNTELWVSPLMNPDGYVLGQRYNANGVDINRNFPMPEGSSHPDGYAHSPETLAMMDFSAQHNFCIGINFHSGALVMNYPWDYTHTLAADNALLRDLSLSYSMHNSPMYNSSEFAQGITNGAAWYVITGSMQDWNYGFTSNMELTAELGNTKWPPASTLDTYWSQNQESILSFIEYAQRGVKGIVSSENGSPLAATIKVSGNARDTKTAPNLGDYHRILLPGTYTISAAAEGYLPQSQQVQVSAGGAGHSIANFSLRAALQISFSGIVRDSDGLPISSAVVQLYTPTPQSFTTSADGSFSFANISEGDYPLQVNAPSYGAFAQIVQLRSGALGCNISITLNAPIFMDTFESDLNAWSVTSPWGRIQEAGNWLLADSPSGNYANNINKSIRLQSPIDLSNVQNPVLSFRAKWALESGYDFVYVEGSPNANDWLQIASFTGSQSSWSDQLFSLSSFAGSNFYLRFRLHSDWSQNADGIYLDDVMISGHNLTHLLYGDANSDGYVDHRDIQAVLEHAVGHSLSASQLIVADTDLQDSVNTLDAYLIHLYTTDASFRFPVQSQSPFSLPVASLSNTLNSDIWNLVLSDSPELRCLYVDIPYEIASVEGYQDYPIMMASDPDSGRLAMISSSFSPTLSISLIDNSSSFTIEAELNGHPTAIKPSSTLDTEVPALCLNLQQNHPNPFNPHTNISFELPTPGWASLKVFNLKGQLIQTLIADQLEAGTHRLSWNAADSAGTQMPSGIYLYRLDSKHGSLTRKMVLSK